MAEDVSRRRKLARFWLRLVCFVLLAALAIGYATYVLTPKHDYGICSMVNLYRQPENTVDVLAVGTSMVYAGVNPNVLWQEYGIAAYDLCSAEQPFWVSYYVIREALKTQHPQLILLDAKPSIYVQDYSRRGRTILSTFGIRGLDNRLGAILACVEKPADALDYILGLPQVHDNYATVTWSDFVIPPDNGGRGENWKGFIEMDAVEHHQRPSMVWTGVKRSMNQREEEYARRIFELCRDEGIEVMLIGMPNPDYAGDHMYYNALWAVAEEYGVTGVNFNQPELRFGLRYSTDFADWQHLNVKGSITLSRALGAQLREQCGIPDRRDDSAYESYALAAQSWYESLPAFESAPKDKGTSE